MKTIQEMIESGDVIDCVPVLRRAALSRPALKTMQVDFMPFCWKMFEKYIKAPKPDDVSEFDETLRLIEAFQAAGLQAPDDTVSMDFQHDYWVPGDGEKSSWAKAKWVCHVEAREQEGKRVLEFSEGRS